MDSVLVYTMEDTVGDGIVKLAFLRDLRARFPAATITWCAGVGPCAYAGTLKPLIAGLIDEVIERAGIGRGLGDILRISAPLGGRRFDLVVDTQSAVPRTLAVKRIRHGMFLSGAAGFRLSDRRPPPGPRPAHLIDRMTGLLDLAAPRPAAPAPLAGDEPRAALARSLLPDGPSYVGIAPGAGDRAKIWPLANFIALARVQAKAGRVPVFFLGPDEEPWAFEIRAAVPEALFPELDPAAAESGLKGPLLAIALGARLDAAVANDSGVGHMLAAGGTALVSLFSKHDPGKYAPRAARLEVIDSKSYGGTDPALIPVADVETALEHLITS